MDRNVGFMALLVVAALLAVLSACSTGSGGGGASGSSSGGGSGGWSGGSSGGSNGGSDSSSGGSCDTGGIDGGVCPVKPAEAEAVAPFDSCASLTSPTVSFERDIRPIFQESCSALSGCHGQANGEQTTPGLVFLGSSDGGTAAATILQNLVNAVSPEDPQLSIVKAGDPANSYMMHKLDGDFCRLAAACNATGQATFLECGIAMPYGLPSLCLDSQGDCVKSQALQQQHGERDQIRRWIAQGASAN
jgi:hypothetical protein